MKKKVILIVCDGLRADVAKEQLGYVQSLVHNHKGHSWTAFADHPSVSKTNYETICTGMPSVYHGVVTNLMARKSKMKRNVFSEVKKQQGVTACVGSHWFYELYGKNQPYEAKTHKEINDVKDEIQYGRFQTGEEVPQPDLLETADFVIHKYKPDFILIHVQDIDHIGHTKGIGKDYVQAVEGLDELLGIYLPEWLKEYTVIINADHGMDQYKNHGGTACNVVNIPFYILSNSFSTDHYLQHLAKIENIYQVDVARIVLDILGIKDFAIYQRDIFKKIKYKPSVFKCVK